MSRLEPEILAFPECLVSPPLLCVGSLLCHSFVSCHHRSSLQFFQLEDVALSTFILPTVVCRAFLVRECWLCIRYLLAFLVFIILYLPGMFAFPSVTRYFVHLSCTLVCVSRCVDGDVLSCGLVVLVVRDRRFET